jgi:hypothetical protein
MATRQTDSKRTERTRESKRNRVDAGAADESSSADHVYGVPVPEALHEAIEMERDNLSKAASVLGCLANSMEYDDDAVDGPYYPDVARLARQLVTQSINALDSLTLQRLLLRDKVKEDFYMPLAKAFYH